MEFDRIYRRLLEAFGRWPVFFYKGIVQKINLGSQKKRFLTLIRMVNFPLQAKRKHLRKKEEKKIHGPIGLASSVGG